MIRKLVIVVASTAILATPVFAERARGVKNGVPGAAWVTAASASQLASHDAVSDETAVPTVELDLFESETGRAYVVTPGELLNLTMSISPNGYNAPVTLFMYRQNRQTGVREYYNIPTRGFLAAGQTSDFFGATGSPIAINTPLLTDFNLFGATGAVGQPLAVASAPGRYQIVVEVRDAAGRRVLSRSNAMYAVVSAIETLTGNLATNRSLSADKAYLLRSAVFVQSGATLTIEPGTVLFGERSSIGTLIVAQGGRLVANGTHMQPIIMTSDQPVGSRARSDWGGLILNGRAPINRPGGIGTGEGNTGNFGGTDAEDSSGSLRFVRVEFAGREFSPDNELNGIAFQGTGRGTQVDYIQVLRNKDDGVEFFGGTTNAKHVLLVANADDSLDWTDGWTGNAQFVVAIHSGEDADNGIEADNLEANNDALPRSMPTIYNATFVGDPARGGESNNGIVLRHGTAGNFHNFIVTGYKKSSVAIRGAVSLNQAASGALVFDNSVVYSRAGDFERNSDGSLKADAVATRDFLTQSMKNNQVGVDPLLVDPFNLDRPNVEPQQGSPALDTRYVKTPPDNGFFDTDVDYIGGVDPGDNWVLSGWATFSDN